MLEKLKGFKVYLIAGLIALVALSTGGSPEDAAKAAEGHAPEFGLVLAAGIALGRAIVALFGKLRSDGLIQCNPLAVALAAALLAGTMPLAGCASVGSAIEQARPQSAREALAEAEIGLTGAIYLATQALQNGHMSAAEAQDLAAKFDDCVSLIQMARAALAAHDEASASTAIDAARALIRSAAMFLSTRAEQVRGGQGV